MAEYVSGKEVAELLRQVIAGEVEIVHADPKQLWKDAFAGNIEFIVAGYRITFFNDCAELDYVDCAIAPDGRMAGFDDWHDRNEKPFDLPRKWEIARLEEKLEQAL